MGVFHARQADGIRVWFTLVDKDGAVITGAVAGDFTATVVDPTGNNSTTATVSEASAKAGLYTFFVPASFFNTYGVGMYVALVEVDKTTSVKITDAITYPIDVDIEDLDGIGIAVNYAGAVHIDTKNGVAGSTAGVHGTISNPVSNLADAVTLAAAIGVRRYTLVGNITLTSAHDDWVIEGRAAEAAVNLGSQDVADSAFRNCQLSGTITTGPIQATDCDIDGVVNFTGHAHQCALLNGTVVGAGTSTFHHCFSAVPGLSTPSLDLNGVASLNVRAYSGGIDLRNVSAPSQNVTLEFVAGQAILAATCTGGVISLRGVGNLTDNSAGSTIEKNAFLSIDAFYAQTVDGTLDAVTALRYMMAMVSGRFTETLIDAGPPEIKDFTFYRRDNTTALFTLRIEEDSGRTRTSG